MSAGDCDRDDCDCAGPESGMTSAAAASRSSVTVRSASCVTCSSVSAEAADSRVKVGESMPRLCHGHADPTGDPLDLVLVRSRPYIRLAVDASTVIGAATAAISAAGLWFASRAAKASERTVRLTRDMQIGADSRQLLDALWRVTSAAHDLTMVPTSLDHQRIFRDHQSVLIGSVSADLPFPDGVREQLDWLVNVEPTDDPERIVTVAKGLWTRLWRERFIDTG